MNELITLTTDFGDQFAVAQLHTVFVDLGFFGKIIENHEVFAYSIIEGAFQIGIISRYSPKGCVHVGVIDPGVGSKRKGIIIKSKRSWFVGPDNGLLYPASMREGILRVWSINEKFFGNNVTSTFHGRDVFVKAASYLALGNKPEDFGCSKIRSDSLISLEFKIGQVLHIDSFGNIKIYWPEKIVNGKKIKFSRGNKNYCYPIVETFSDVGSGKPLALLGSSGTLEIAINFGSANNELGLKVGEVINLKQK